MHLVELIPAAATDAAILDDLEKFLVTTLGKGVIRAKDTPNFIANRVGVFSMLATVHHARAARHRLRRGGRADRHAHRPSPQRDLPHRRRGGARHLRARRQHHEGDAAGRSLAQVLRGPGLAQAADRRRGRSARRPRKGVYQKIGNDIQVLDLKTQELPALRRQGGRRRGRDPQEQGRRRALRAAARLEPSAGAVPVVHLPRRVPLLRGEPGGHRRQRARSRSRDSLGLRLEPGAVRDLAGRGLAAGSPDGSPRTSQAGKGDGRRAVAGMGDGEGPHGRARRAGLVFAGGQRLQAALVAARLSPPAVPGPAAGRGRRSTARPSSRPTRCAAGTPATTSRSSASRAACTPSATTCWTAWCRRWTRPSATTWASSSGRPSRRSRSGRTSRRRRPAARGRRSRRRSAGCSGRSGARRNRWRSRRRGASASPTS